MDDKEYIEIQEGRSDHRIDVDISTQKLVEPDLPVWTREFLEKYSEYIQEPILDIGCSGGDFLNQMRTESKFGIGMDISRTAVARTILTGLGAVHWNMEKEFPFPEKIFKTVTMFHSLEHSRKPEETLKHITKVLKGYICIIVPNGFPRKKEFADVSYFPELGAFKEYFRDYEIIVAKPQGANQWLLIAKYE